MDIVLASRNAGKLDELSVLLSSLSWRLRLVSEFTEVMPNESAPSFVENALLKARHAARVSGLPAIADDSGLEVVALDGAPGVRSARYAGENATDTDNNQKLLAALKDVPDARRGARYVCVMVYLRHAEDPLPVISLGTWRGRILHNPRGDGGFGYDPLFQIEGLARSVAELELETKNQLSHRGKAVRHLSSLLHDVHD